MVKTLKRDEMRVQMQESSLHYREWKSHVKISLRQTNLVIGWPFYPRGLYYHPHFVREVKADPSGAKTTQKKGFPDEAQFSLGITILYNGKKQFYSHFGL